MGHWLGARAPLDDQCANYQTRCWHYWAVAVPSDARVVGKPKGAESVERYCWVILV